MRKHIDDFQVATWYINDHLTMAEIGERLGVSRQAVYKRLKALNINAEQSEHVNTHCYICDRAIDVLRKRWRTSEHVFCGRDCHVIYLKDKLRTGLQYQPWRHGSRIARVIVRQWFDLQPEHVVHHDDHNQRNNDRANLMVFASQADHMSYHHGTKVTPLWIGKEQGEWLNCSPCDCVGHSAHDTAQLRGKLT